MPYKGYNYEDSAIMSESAAKKLTSQHMYDLKTKRSAKGVFSKEKFIYLWDSAR
jgi:DNA-directed RNA polymerase beta subunit